MAGIIDYAGLFPPSALEMDEAIRNYARYRGEADREMLSHFICPATRLHELDKYSDELFSVNPPFTFSVLSKGSDSPKTFLDAVSEDLDLLKKFYKTHGNRGRVEALEIKTPVAETAEETAEMLNIAARLINARMPNDVAVFYEPSLKGDWKSAVDTLAEAIKLHNEVMANGVRYLRGGLKLRCGGITKDLFPDDEQVARVIHLCLKNSIPYKATAGLHHPVRFQNDEIGVLMHGFLNVFGAGIFGKVFGLSEAQILEIIQDKDPANFEFTDSYFSWKRYKATDETIREARESLATSFGSCSFDEPREDLKTHKFI